MTTVDPAAELDWLARRLPALLTGARRPGPAHAAWPRVAQGASMQEAIERLLPAMDLEPAAWSAQPRAASLPMLAWLPGEGACIVHAEAEAGQWLTETARGTQRRAAFPADTIFCPLHTAPKPAADGSARGLFRRVLREQRGAFGTAAAATLVANVVALAGSLYSMQVYDRVIPTQGLSTLVVLTVGALMACLFELVIKMARASILESSVRQMDGELSHRLFQRLVDIRLDQLPPSVGSLSAQVRSYESIRSFASAATMYVAVDAPFALLFLGVMAMLAGPVLALVPAVSFVIAVGVGLMYRRRIAQHAASASAAGNRKAGLLVETIENAESIKASGTGWAQLSKWSQLSRQSLDDELKIRHYSESSQYFAGFVQQASYIAMIAVGATIAATTSSLTTGGLIACSILSGRVLGPIGMLPGLIVQWAHARTALEQLERIFALESDHHGISRPLAPASVQGGFRAEDLRFAYPGRPPVVALQRLVVQPGEKVAILGPVGAGKSTLLKLLAGLFKPEQGRVLLDGLEIQQIARESLSRMVGYLPQEVRLESGTLRSNLTLGHPEAGEAAVLAACRATGLMGLIAGHPKGLELEIAEGGSGVSGGQRQLIGLTRLVLSAPSVWLLDEPTSSMDETNERQCLQLLQQSMRPEQTLLLVTHKPQLLSLVQRIVVMTHEGIVLDGPRDAVLKALADNARQAAATTLAAAAVPAPISREIA